MPFICISNMPAFTKKVKKLLLNDKQLVDEFLQSLRVLGLFAALTSYFLFYQNLTPRAAADQTL